MNIFDSLERAKTYTPQKEALLFNGTSTCYLDLYQQVSQLSSALKARFKLEKGDRVGIFLPNIPEFVVSYFAVVQLGGIAVSLNVMLKRDEVAFILKDSGAKVLITAMPLLDQVPETIPTLQGVVCVGEPSRPGVIPYQDLLSESLSPLPKVSLEGDDGAAILYTSGTTGKPKGVLLSHRNLVSNVYATNHHTRMEPEDRLICFVPLFHCFGQNFVMNASVNAGATLILHERFNPDEILGSTKLNRASMFFAVPTVYLRLLELPDIEEQLASVRYYFTAAAPMPVEVADSWQQRFGQIIFEGYGLTETSPFASYNHDFSYRAGSIGIPIENVEMKIVDERGNDVLPGEVGEIAIKGPNVMTGYFHQPEETAKAIREGWFHSGDIGRMDEQGYFYLVDRAKDMINVSGFKVWPREVEEVLQEYPTVMEAAVVGVPDRTAGEAVKAFVVLKANTTVQEQQLIDFCRDRIAVYKAPRTVEFVAALPKNPAGKILKRQLRETDTQKNS
ncbi:MAG: long-chain fatty acid--CoA ligase [Acidobacteria bacterium]|nr:long-chain fatty acid--CoA ligase [Acidobacteriota bacterium]MCZ6768763.1 long-chain fatty acid--CoA ligase [Acidobacteriota bacterium]MCZ6876930.1 long-chain fatty acid--CoA ligase [Acidobacteriota bacterium]